MIAEYGSQVSPSPRTPREERGGIEGDGTALLYPACNTGYDGRYWIFCLWGTKGDCQSDGRGLSIGTKTEKMGE